MARFEACGNRSRLKVKTGAWSFDDPLEAPFEAQGKWGKPGAIPGRILHYISDSVKSKRNNYRVGSTGVIRTGFA